MARCLQFPEMRGMCHLTCLPQHLWQGQNPMDMTGFPALSAQNQVIHCLLTPADK